MNKQNSIIIVGVVIMAFGGYLAVTTSNNDISDDSSSSMIKDMADTAPLADEYVIDAADMIVPEIFFDVATSTAVELSDSEVQGLIAMREEEKLAHDVYITLYELWGVKIFSNIAASEQTHTDTIKYLLDTFEISDPVVTTEVGVFTDPHFQALYDQLVASGSQSLADAYLVGMTIEDLDIFDLEKLVAETDNEDIISAYANLIKGSRNHMRAFNRQLVRSGGEYEARYLSVEEIQSIILGSQERGRI